jgi:transcriptional regulator with XRE-family HTH domain
MEQASQMAQVSGQVRRRRVERGWTLDVAAQRLKISRRLLAQIEASDANPSLSTLLSIAAGFDISLIELLGHADTPTISLQGDNAAARQLWTGPAGGFGRLLVASGGLELWDWLLEAGEERRSEPHRAGAREALSVAAGAVTVQVGAGEPVVVRRGQSAAFRAEAPHRYANESSKPARFTLAVYEAD